VNVSASASDLNPAVSFRWVHGFQCTPEEWSEIDKMLQSVGSMSLNRQTSSILLAEVDKEIVGFHVFQSIPFAGPLYVVPSARGTGIADVLVVKLLEFLAAAEVRGFIAIVQSKHAEKACVAIGMNRVESPVYILGGRA
jgi:GNAT superfamily N-acetyltransferase